MKFKKIKFKNFFAFKEGQLDLEDQGFCLIEGLNLFDGDGGSNGAGKSTMFDALVWCLTGETIRATKRVQNRDTLGTVEVILDLEDRGHEYQIIRTKEPSTLTIMKDGIDISAKGIRDTEQALKNEFSDLTADIIGNIIVMGQDLPRCLTKNTPVRRKEILESLTKSDYMIEDLKIKLDKKKEQAKLDLRSLEDEKLKLNTTIGLVKSRLEESENSLDKATSVNTEDLKKELEDVVEKLNYNNEKPKKDLEEIREAGEALTTIIEKKKEEYEKTKSIILENHRKDIFENDKVISEIKNKIKDYNTKITECKKEFCPTCKQRIAEFIDTSEMEKELEEIKGQLFEVDEIKKSLLDKKFPELDIRPWEDDEKERAECREEYRKEYEAQNNLNRTIKDLEKRKSEIELELASLESTIERYKKEIEEYKDLIKATEEKIEKIEVGLESSKSYQTTLNSIYSYTTKEFRTELLEDIIKEISRLCDKYSSKLWPDTKVNFRQEDQVIFIGYDDKEFEGCSGGERQRVNIVVQLAIREFLLKCGFSSNLLVMDEPYTGLDKSGVMKVNNLISELGIESIFVITHTDKHLVPYDTRIMVTKDKIGESKVSVEL